MPEKPKFSTPASKRETPDTDAKRAELEAAETAMFTAEIGDSPSVDLHEMTVNLAISEVETFLHQELLRGTDAVRIIHGRGEQKLRQAVWAFLEKSKKQDLVIAYRDATHHGQQGGVTIVALQRLKSSR